MVVPAAATAPALVVVGIFMMQSIGEIDLSDFKTAAPVRLTIIGIPLTFSLGRGLISAAFLAVFLGEPKRMTPVGHLIAGVFFLEFPKFWPFR